MVHRSVLQWTRGEGTVVAVHCSTEERAYLCRCTSFPLYDAFCDCFLWLHSTNARVNFAGKSKRFLTFSKKNHTRESKVLLFLLLFLHSVMHFFIFSIPNRSRKPPFSMSVSGKNLFRKIHRYIYFYPKKHRFEGI